MARISLAHDMRGNLHNSGRVYLDCVCSALLLRVCSQALHQDRAQRGRTCLPPGGQEQGKEEEDTLQGPAPQ